MLVSPVSAALVALLTSADPVAGTPRPVGLSTALTGASIERSETLIHGLPVRGAYQVTERPRSGDPPRTLAERRPRSAAQLAPRDAGIDEAAARALIRDRYGVWPTSTTLVYWLILGHPVLTWEHALPIDHGPPASRLVVWMSASSGRVLDTRETVLHARARVFPINPVVTPETVEVDLPGLDGIEPGSPLVSTTHSPTLEVSSCVPAEMGGCESHTYALADDSGDFLTPVPNIAIVDDNVAVDDAFSEVSAYYHATRFFEELRARGLESVHCDRLLLRVNEHGVDPNTGELAYFGNAFFLDQCEEDAPAMVIVGQADGSDYAYDGDVVNHELAHSVIQDLSPFGLQSRRFTAHGIVSQAGSLNEGMADYFAAALAGDPQIAEYVGRYVVGSSQEFVRTLLNPNRCPDDMTGIWHTDGQIFSGALWTAREAIGPVVDELVLLTLPLAPPDAELEEFAALLLGVAEERAAAGVLTDDDVEFLARTLEGRGLRPCPHVIRNPEVVTLGARTVVVGDNDGIEPYAPGPMQLRYEVPAGAHEVTVLFTVSGATPPDERAMRVLVTYDDRPMEFSYVLGPPPEDQESAQDEIVYVTGTEDDQVVAQSLNGEEFIVQLPVEPGDVLHVALANDAPDTATITDWIVTTPTGPTVQLGETGCGCDSGARRDAPGLALAILAMIGLGRRRRRTTTR